MWKQRTGTYGIDMTPIVEFMDFVNNSSDDEFESALPEELDTQAFATYLAVEDLIGNSDTISGPGNNGYLHYDPQTGLMTVVAWDHDLAFDSMGGFAGGPGGTPPEGMAPPEGTTGPEGAETPQSLGEAGAGGPGVGGGMGGSNVLESRFLASATFNEMYQSTYADLRAKLIESGFGEDVLDEYANLLIDDAGDLISASTVEREAAVIQSFLTRAATSQPAAG